MQRGKRKEEINLQTKGHREGGLKKIRKDEKRKSNYHRPLSLKKRKKKTMDNEGKNKRGGAGDANLNSWRKRVERES